NNGVKIARQFLSESFNRLGSTITHSCRDHRFLVGVDILRTSNRSTRFYRSFGRDGVGKIRRVGRSLHIAAMAGEQQVENKTEGIQITGGGDRSALKLFRACILRRHHGLGTYGSLAATSLFYRLKNLRDPKI